MNRMIHPVLRMMCIALFLSLPRPAAASEPCCSIVSINGTQGTVVGKEAATGRTFQFVVSDVMLLKQLKTGQLLMADFKTNTVTIQAHTYSITKVTSGPAVPVAGGAAKPIGPCCSVVAIDAASGLVAAKSTASGKTFLFTSADKRLVNNIKIGSEVRFTRAAGLSVEGLPAMCCKPIRPPKPHGNTNPKLDCSKTPEACPGYKPGPKIDKMGGTTWNDVIDYCWDSPDNCVSGPN